MSPEWKCFMVNHRKCNPRVPFQSDDSIYDLYTIPKDAGKSTSSTQTLYDLLLIHEYDHISLYDAQEKRSLASDDSGVFIYTTSNHFKEVRSKLLNIDPTEYKSEVRKDISGQFQIAMLLVFVSFFYTIESLDEKSTRGKAGLISNITVKLAVNLHTDELAINDEDWADDAQRDGYSPKLFYPAVGLKLEKLVRRLQIVYRLTKKKGKTSRSTMN
ncbi:unnamed protein product [Rotaria sp. Silwood1]|nr:unnamed protein product [Rotaria sp. Silwood1]